MHRSYISSVELIHLIDLNIFHSGTPNSLDIVAAGFLATTATGLYRFLDYLCP
jgi:hypothetical protein